MHTIFHDRLFQNVLVAVGLIALYYLWMVIDSMRSQKRTRRKAYCRILLAISSAETREDLLILQGAIIDFHRTFWEEDFQDTMIYVNLLNGAWDKRMTAINTVFS